MASLPPPAASDGVRVAGRRRARFQPRAEGVLFVLCGLLAAGGAPLPWAAVSASFIDTVYKAGIDGDGRVTLALGAAAGVLGVVVLVRPGRGGRLLPACGLVLATIITMIALVNVADVGSVVGSLNAEARALLDTEVGIGLWLTLVAGLTGMAGGVVALRRHPAV